MQRGNEFLSSQQRYPHVFFWTLALRWLHIYFLPFKFYVLVLSNTEWIHVENVIAKMLNMFGL